MIFTNMEAVYTKLHNYIQDKYNYLEEFYFIFKFEGQMIGNK